MEEVGSLALLSRCICIWKGPAFMGVGRGLSVHVVLFHLAREQRLQSIFRSYSSEPSMIFHHHLIVLVTLSYLFMWHRATIPFSRSSCHSCFCEEKFSYTPIPRTVTLEARHRMLHIATCVIAVDNPLETLGFHYSSHAIDVPIDTCYSQLF